MTTKTDVYNITAKASLGGLRAATKAVKASGNAIRDLGRKAGAAARGGIAKAILGVLLLTKAAKGALRGIKFLALSLAGLAVGGLLAVFGLVRSLPALFGAMRTAMEGAAGAAGGAASDLSDVAEAADSAAGGIKDVADESVKAAKKITGIFGAFAEVGEGFVQTQGRIFDQAKDTAEKAVKAAKDATVAMEDVETAVGGATESTSRFGKALDRISTAWERAKNIILRALAKAITPALEALADLMESPVFEKFVDLLAEDLAGAVETFSDWLIKEGIPALERFMKKVNKVGGPLAWLKMKFGWLRKKIKLVLSQIATTWGEKWEKMEAKVKTILELIGDAVDGAMKYVKSVVVDEIDEIKAALLIFGTALQEPFAVLPAFVAGIFDTLKSILKNKINDIIDVINGFIDAYNAVSAIVGLSPIDRIKHISLAKGGIVSSPVAAIVGDNPTSPEVVAPLHELVGIIREALGGLGTGLTVNITVPMTPGGYTPEEAGRRAADSFVLAARAQGIRV